MNTQLTTHCAKSSDMLSKTPLRLNLLFLAFLGLSARAFAQTTTMTLAECLDYAYANSPQLQIANLQIRDADLQIKENLAGGLPQVSASVSYSGFIQRGGLPSSALSFGPSGPVQVPSSVTDNFTDSQVDGLFELLGSLFQSDPNSKIYFAPVHGITGGITANQLIFSNTYSVSRRAARYYRQYVQEQLLVAKRTVQHQVIDAYLPALLLGDNLGILDKNIANLEKLLNDTKAINKAGFAEQLDVDRLELSLATLRSERGNLVRQREIVLNAVKLTMNYPVEQSLELKDNTEQLLRQYGDVDLTSDVNFMNRPEYTQVLKGRELSALQVEIYQKPWLPTVAGFVQYQPQLQGGFGAKDSPGFNKWYFIPSAVAGLSVSVPIYDGGTAKAKKERAMVTVQTLDVQKKQLENLIRFEVDNARKQYLNAQERVGNQQKNLALAQRIYDTTQTKYKAGVGSSFEITQAESSLYAAQQALLQAQYDLLIAKAAVKKALGQ